MPAVAARVPSTFADDGYAVVSGVLPPDAVAAAVSAANRLFALHCRPRAGVRDPVLHDRTLATIAARSEVVKLAAAVLGPGAMLVRSILFDKTPGANWDVAWHQDVTIAVAAQHDVPGYGPWSSKAGVPSVQPPAAVLEAMVTIRIHLDDCGPENGPLLVVPGSHRRGLLDVRSLDPAACDREAVACTAKAGDAVLMRPLTLHASRRALIPAHRRVLHLDFAAGPLPAPLVWYAALH